MNKRNAGKGEDEAVEDGRAREVRPNRKITLPKRKATPNSKTITTKTRPIDSSDSDEEDVTEARSVSSPSYIPLPEALAKDYALSQKDLLDQVVEKAVNEALNNFRYPTAFALRALYSEGRENEAFSGLLARVINQTATPTDVRQFGRLFAARNVKVKKTTKPTPISYHQSIPGTRFLSTHPSLRLMHTSSNSIYPQCAEWESSRTKLSLPRSGLPAKLERRLPTMPRQAAKS
ncbi:hypothetical protein B0T14DRAFT_238951 [Immersiella caudata]|uniref:Uncharacterized protein n=1 Tax=Immersiella caudata TaxID=314043 RepID=A0AA40C0Y3_9PEZI|nr:hypothetical protein B0T14DRAFT_238951 [Immersiella caudata]